MEKNLENKFQNENLEKIYKFLKNLNHEEIITKLNLKFPNWIEDICDNYREDYPHLINNWKIICKKIGTTPKKILLVSELINSGFIKILIKNYIIIAMY